MFIRRLLQHACVLSAMYIAISIQCSPRYITRPNRGYLCETSVYKNLIASSFQRCAGLCINSVTCWTASYNHAEQCFLLASEMCMLANVNTQFSMMIVRLDETPHRVNWASFSSTFGKRHGFPPRAIRYNGRKDTVAREVHGEDVIVGWATSLSYSAYLIGWDYRKVHLGQYEVLLVGKSCSVAWTPYIVGKAMPNEVVVAGVDRDMRKKYILRVVSGTKAYYGSYTEGDAFGYYEYRGVKRSTSFSVLVELC